MTVKELHRQAMHHCDKAVLYELAGRPSEARAEFRLAFEHERDAALSLTDRTDAEPTRSILFRSAAALALDVDDPAEALRLIALGLRPGAPSEIAAELTALRDRALATQRQDNVINLGERRASR